jgi:hypothetical protein
MEALPELAAQAAPIEGQMSSDFEARSVAYGLKEGEFENLPPLVRRKLIRLMARIAEQSYRRGFQHGAAFGDKAC